MNVVGNPEILDAKLPLPLNVIVPFEYVPPVTALIVVVVGEPPFNDTDNTFEDESVVALT